MANVETTHVNPLAISFLDRLEKLHKLVGDARERIEGANGTLTSAMVESVLAEIRDGEFGVRIAGMATRKSLINEPRVSSETQVQ
jgi:hypothetical protein